MHHGWWPSAACFEANVSYLRKCPHKKMCKVLIHLPWPLPLSCNYVVILVMRISVAHLMLIVELRNGSDSIYVLPLPAGLIKCFGPVYGPMEDGPVSSTRRESVVGRRYLRPSRFDGATLRYPPWHFINTWLIFVPSNKSSPSWSRQMRLRCALLPLFKSCYACADLPLLPRLSCRTQTQ